MTGRPDAPIAVLGAGSWGTALAILLARNGRPTVLWGRDAHHMAHVSAERHNARYLPGIVFPESLQVSADLTQTAHIAHDILLVVPSQALRALVEQLAPLMSAGHRLAWATKGLEAGSAKLPHEIVAERLGRRIPTAVISGPTFARQVAAGLPAAVTLACVFPEFATALAASLHGDSFRVYTSDDVTGVELGGAVKNVLAIAAGIADGLDCGANTRAALITRGLAEMMRLGEALGGRRETFMGLAGLGDLVLTCTDDESRNRRLGLALGRGQGLADALRAIGQVVEGVQTAREVLRLAAKAGVEMPICEQVYRVLYDHVSAREAVQALLAREQKPEII